MKGIIKEWIIFPFGDILIYIDIHSYGMLMVFGSLINSILYNKIQNTVNFFIIYPTIIIFIFFFSNCSFRVWKFIKVYYSFVFSFGICVFICERFFIWIVKDEIEDVCSPYHIDPINYDFILYPNISVFLGLLLFIFVKFLIKKVLF